MALPIARLSDFVAGTEILDSEVDAEFNQILVELNALPEKDGTTQTNLDADMLDTYHASTSGGTGTIPVCNGTAQVNLNADMVDGLHASDIAAAAFAPGTALVFYNSSAPSGWTLVTAPTDHVLGWKSGATGGTGNGSNFTVTGLTTTINGTALTISQLPTHTHTMTHTHTVTYTGAFGLAIGNSPVGIYTPAAGNVMSISGTPLSIDNFTGNTGSSGANSTHTHTGTVSSDGTWRPPTKYVIIATKD